MREFVSNYDAWLSWLWVTSWQASVVVCLVLSAKFAFRRQLNARWQYGLWMLFVARLFMPVAPPSEMSVFNLASLHRESIETNDVEPSEMPTPIRAAEF